MKTLPPLSDEMLGYVTNRWSRRVVQPLLIALLNTALFTGAAVILALVTGDAEWLRMPWLCLIICLEGIYTTLWLNHPNQRITNHAAYRAAELVVLVLGTRLFTWALSGSFPQYDSVEQLLRDPFLLFADGLFIVGTVLIIVAWTRALSLTDVFSRLAIDATEAHFFLAPKSARSEDNRPQVRDRSALVADFFQQWIWGGVALALFATVSTFDVPGLIRFQNPLNMMRAGLLPEMLLGLFVYFLAGFLLHSQARLAVANARWLREGVRKSPEVERSWHRNSMWLLLIVALIAAFLPLGSTVGIGRILEAVLVLFGALFTLLSLIVASILAMLLPAPSEIEAGVPTPTPEMVPTPEFIPTPAPPAPPSETAEIVFSSAFWAVAIVLTVVAISFFLRERGIRWQSAQIFLEQVWEWLKTSTQQLWGEMRRQSAALRQAVQTRLNVEPAPADGEGDGKRPFRFLRVNSLPPREQIRYFYLSTVRRAEERGVPRRADETPLEYLGDLQSEFPDAEGDVELLTAAFLKARYSPQPIDEDEVNPVKKQWKQVRARIRRRRQASVDDVGPPADEAAE